jgi:uncharacterized coiled-coil protein SlyX
MDGDPRLRRLEERLAHLERRLELLHEVVLRQDRRLERLARQLEERSAGEGGEER